jgi:hypothetical protein
MHAEAVADDLEMEAQNLHPAGLTGVDPFDFCNSGRPGNAFDPARGRTFVERVISFVDQYKQPVV